MSNSQVSNILIKGAQTLGPTTSTAISMSGDVNNLLSITTGIETLSGISLVTGSAGFVADSTSGPITLTGDAASKLSTSAGLLTIGDSTNITGVTVNAGTSAATLTLGGGAGAVAVGTADSTTVTIGSATNSTGVTVNSGTGGLTLGGAGAGTVTVGSTATTQITVGTTSNPVDISASILTVTAPSAFTGDMIINGSLDVNGVITHDGIISTVAVSTIETKVAIGCPTTSTGTLDVGLSMCRGGAGVTGDVSAYTSTDITRVNFTATAAISYGIVQIPDDDAVTKLGSWLTIGVGTSTQTVQVTDVTDQVATINANPAPQTKTGTVTFTNSTGALVGGTGTGGIITSFLSELNVGDQITVTDSSTLIDSVLTILTIADDTNATASSDLGIDITSVSTFTRTYSVFTPTTVTGTMTNFSIVSGDLTNATDGITEMGVGATISVTGTAGTVLYYVTAVTATTASILDSGGGTPADDASPNITAVLVITPGLISGGYTTYNESTAAFIYDESIDKFVMGTQTNSDQTIYNTADFVAREGTVESLVSSTSSTTVSATSVEQTAITGNDAVAALAVKTAAANTLMSFEGESVDSGAFTAIDQTIVSDGTVNTLITGAVIEGYCRIYITDNNTGNGVTSGAYYLPFYSLNNA